MSQGYFGLSVRGLWLQAGFVPFIELTLKSKKSLASIAQHLVSKWSLDQPSGARPALLAPSLTGCTVRLVPNIDRGEALSALSWGVADKSVAAAEVFALVGKPDIFRLKYRLLPPDCPLPAAAPAHSQGALFDQAGPQQPGAGSWPGHSGLPHSPLRPAGLSSPQYASAVSRGAWPPGSATEPQPHRSYRPVSPHHLPASPLRGHAAADDGSQRAFFWAADPSVETLGRAWEPPPPRYMPVSNSAPLGRGPGANDGAAFGDSLEQDMFGGRGGGEQAGMPTGGGGWLDNVEGVSISGFLNADGLRGAASSPFLDGHRSRSSLGLGSPPFSPQFWSPEPNSRAPFRAPADRAPLRQRSRLTAATALLGTILEDRNPPGDTDEREPLPHGALASSRSCSGLGAGPGGWGGAEDALPLKDLGSGESVAGLAPMLEGFGMALSTDGFDVQNWDKWASRSRFSASPGGAVVARPESCKRSPDKPRGSRSESREAVPCDESEGLERGAAREQSVDEADQLRVLEEPFEGGADERDLLKLRPDPDLYWGNSLGGFEDPRPPSLAYSAPSQDDFLLRAPAPLEIPFGDSLLLRSLESSNDGFLPATREVSKGLGRQGSARRPSSSGLGRSRSSGDLVSPAKGKRAAGTETGVEDTEAEPAGGKVRPSSPQPRPGSGMARGKGAESTAPGGQPPGEGVAQGPNAEGSRARRRSPSVGAGSQFQLSKAVLGEQPRSEGDAGGEATVPASKPFMALFPALPGQLTQVGAAASGARGCLAPCGCRVSRFAVHCIRSASLQALIVKTRACSLRKEGRCFLTLRSVSRLSKLKRVLSWMWGCRRSCCPLKKAALRRPPPPRQRRRAPPLLRSMGTHRHKLQRSRSRPGNGRQKGKQEQSPKATAGASYRKARHSQANAQQNCRRLTRQQRLP